MKHAAQTALGAIVALCAVGISVPATAAWEPVRPVEFIVPAGTGGGADQMARTIQGIVTKHNLMKQPMVVINKSGGAGGEGFLDLKGIGRQSAQDHHHAVQPLHHPSCDRHPVQLEGSDAGRDAGARRVRALGQRREAVQDRERLCRCGEGRACRAPSRWAAPARSRKTRSSPSRVEKATGAKFTYIPYKGGGEVAVQLVGNHVDSTVNNPIEAVAQWRGGKLRPLCVFDAQPMAYDEQIADGKSWKDIPTCKSQGLDIEYLMLRGIFMSPRATKDQVEYYIELFKKVRATPEWQDFMKSGAFNTTFLTGADYAKWVEVEEKRHEVLMKDAGFLATAGN